MTPLLQTQGISTPAKSKKPPLFVWWKEVSSSSCRWADSPVKATQENSTPQARQGVLYSVDSLGVIANKGRPLIGPLGLGCHCHHVPWSNGSYPVALGPDVEHVNYHRTSLSLSHTHKTTHTHNHTYTQPPTHLYTHVHVQWVQIRHKCGLSHVFHNEHVFENVLPSVCFTHLCHLPLSVSLYLSLLSSLSPLTPSPPPPSLCLSVECPDVCMYVKCIHLYMKKHWSWCVPVRSWTTLP